MIRLRHGFTLIEMITSTGILSVLLVGMASAILLAGRALPDGRDPASRLARAAAFRSRLASELAYARAVTELTPRAVTFSIPDRTGTPSNETLRYAWSGVPGDPVTRQRNGGAAVPVLQDVHEFVLVYDRLREPLPLSWDISDEQTFHTFGSTTGLLTATIGASNSLAQRIAPNLPSSAAWWRITRVTTRARANGSAVGETRVQIRGSSSGLPNSIVHDSASLLESSLGTEFGWKELTFTRDVRLAPEEAVCVVFRWVSDDPSCDVQTRGELLGGGMSRSSDSGSSWTSELLQSIPLEVRGVVATVRPQEYRYRLSDVRMLVRCGAEPGRTARYAAGVRLLNSPQVPAP